MERNCHLGWLDEDDDEEERKKECAWMAAHEGRKDGRWMCLNECHPSASSAGPVFFFSSLVISRLLGPTGFRRRQRLATSLSTGELLDGCRRQAGVVCRNERTNEQMQEG